VEALDEEENGDFKFEREGKLAILEDVLKAVDEKRKMRLQKRWKDKKGGKEIITRDKLDKVLEWVNMFKEAGDIAVQYDPAHAALPWAGVCFLLQVRPYNSILSFLRPDGLHLGDCQR
jgi:N-terminal domain of NWD NACHT-NTPase